MPSLKLNIIRHPLGISYRLSGFSAPYQRYLVSLVGAHDVRAIMIANAIYVPWHDIEPHTSPAVDKEEFDKSFAQNSLPIYDSFILFEEIHAERDTFIALTRRRLGVILLDSQRSAPQTNPFALAVKYGSVWRDIALVACHDPLPRNVHRLMAAYETFLISCAKGDADSVGLPQFFRSLLDAAEVGCASGSDAFAQLWHGGHGFLMPALPSSAFSVANSLLQLVRAAEGWRGDPQGSVCPGTLMGECVRLLQPYDGG